MGGNNQPQRSEGVRLDQLLAEYAPVEKTGQRRAMDPLTFRDASQIGGSLLQDGGKDVYISKVDPKRSIMVREFNFGNNTLGVPPMNLARNRMKLLHNNLVKFLGVYDKTEDDWCGGLGFIIVIVEYFPKTLRNLVLERVQSRENTMIMSTAASKCVISSFTKIFGEEELTKFLATIARTQLFLKANMGLFFSDIHEENIIFGHDGTLKLVDINTYNPEANSGYWRSLKTSNYKAVLSPQELAGVGQKSKVAPGDPEKNAVFSLGIIILSACFGLSHEYFYDYSTYNIRYNVVSEKLGAMRGYSLSRMFAGCLGNMLNLEEQQRPNFQQLISMLEAHSKFPT